MAERARTGPRTGSIGLRIESRFRAVKQFPITKNNHYVPCMYLKRFESRPRWIYRYDLLVPNVNCPVWVEKPIDRVASATDHLHEHQWTILDAPDDVTWPATDNPVIRLNFHDDRKYNFKGGWGSQGTEIFMPLDPKHMVYTRIGQTRPDRGTHLESRMAEMFAKFTREHAFRHIFSPVKDQAIPRHRPRYINLEMYRNEKAEWAKWAEEQANAELDLNRSLPGG
jgi:hypothetical protein